MRQAHVDSIDFCLLDWQDMEQMTRDLASQVEQSGKSYDRIIAVANGGLTMARHFGDRLAMKKISLLQTAFYKGINSREPEPEVLQPLAVDVTGEKLLVFEDIVDTGATLEFVTALLIDQYGAASVDVAALITKSWTAVHPTYSANEIDRWIIYPYETRESIESLWKKWSSAGKSSSECVSMLTEIGFEAQDISQYGGK